MMLDALFVDQAVAHCPETKGIIDRVGLKPIFVSHAQQVYDRFTQLNTRSADPIRAGKQLLYLTRNKGAFLKKCPGTTHYTCCDYEILHTGSFCTMDCAYCILQVYFHPPILQYFVNHSDLLHELKQRFQEPRIGRIGTGEFTDSMIWERWTKSAELLVPQFGDQGRTVLELKTKTTAISTLEHLPHNGKTIMAWSLNTERVIATEERGTASLPARLKAAAQCQAWGYPVAFHFDPLILYPGWETEYGEVIQRLFKEVDPRRVVWISLGALRFTPQLKLTIEQRFPDSKMVYGEFIPGLDNKMRYFKPLRIELFRHINELIKRYAPAVTVYLCMEDEDVWRNGLGFIPVDRGGLPAMLDASAVKHCGISAP